MNKEEILKLFRKQKLQPSKPRKIAKILGLPLEDAPLVEDLLDELAEDGLLTRMTRKRYALPASGPAITGKLQMNEKGFGFVIPESDSGKQKDIYIPRTAIHGAMHGDRVTVRIGRKRKGRHAESPAGEIVSIVERAKNLYVGKVYKGPSGLLVHAIRGPYIVDVSVKREDSAGAKPGDKVALEIIEAAHGTAKPQGVIVENLGKAGTYEAEAAALFIEFNLPGDFSDEVLEEEKLLPSQIPESELANRLDLRKLWTVTIDPDDAKDFDDAISVERTDEGFRLGVHIADVSYYVKPGCAIDEEGFKRGNSIYLPGKAIPMLPEKLTRELACLRPDEDSLAFSALMEIDNAGQVINTKIARTVIHSDMRLTYGRAAAIIDDPDRASEPEPIVDLLLAARELGAILHALRLARGALELSLTAAAVIFDLDGSVREIVAEKREVSNSIIEEFMLLANEQAAKFLSAKKMPVFLRTHEKPDDEDLIEFAEFAKSLGLPVRREPDRKELQKTLTSVRGKPLEQAVNFTLLRSLKQARYSAEYGTHYALALDYYTHFTSPIRRYPDLVVHRLLQKALGGYQKEDKKKLFKQLPNVAEHCSGTERDAEKAEREFVKLRSCLYLEEKIGQVFDGIISGVQDFGFFVQIENPPVEGLVHVTSLGRDYYEYNPSRHALTGKRGGEVYRIGDRLKVRLKSVVVERRYIDFEVV